MKRKSPSRACRRAKLVAVSEAAAFLGQPQPRQLGLPSFSRMSFLKGGMNRKWKKE